jgi:hypothetical protein
MTKALFDALIASLPILVLIGFWWFAMRTFAKRQTTSVSVQERILAAADRQAVALERIAAALEVKDSPPEA